LFKLTNIDINIVIPFDNRTAFRKMIIGGREVIFEVLVDGDILSRGVEWSSKRFVQKWRRGDC